MSAILTWVIGKVSSISMEAILKGIAVTVVLGAIIFILKDWRTAHANAAIYKNQRDQIAQEMETIVHQERAISTRLKADLIALNATLQRRHNEVVTIEKVVTKIKTVYKDRYLDPVTNKTVIVPPSPAVTMALEAIREQEVIQ